MLLLLNIRDLMTHDALRSTRHDKTEPVVSRLFIRYSLWLGDDVTVELSCHNHGLFISDDQMMHVDPSVVRRVQGWLALASLQGGEVESS